MQNVPKRRPDHAANVGGLERLSVEAASEQRAFVKLRAALMQRAEDRSDLLPA